MTTKLLGKRGNAAMNVMINSVMSQDSEKIIAHLGQHNHAFSGMNVLVTGAAGFLGQNFISYFAHLNGSKLLQSPVRVIALDNFLTGKQTSLAPFISEHLNLISHDITKPFNTPVKVDFIIHAASIASPVFYRRYPIETMDANIIGLRNLLDYAISNPVESFLFFSSSEVYGDPVASEIPTSEDYNGNVSFTGPRACYDESKRFGETLCINFWRIHKVPVKIVRPFNNYGPGLNLNDRRVLPDFFRDVINGQDIVLLSDGKATRTFCYISDALEGYLRVLLSKHNGEAFNIGTETPEISIHDVATEVIRISGKRLKVIHQKDKDEQYLTDNPQRRCPSIAKARTCLDYNPSVTLNEGLTRSYRYYLEQSQ
jgi:nucleoside-diphosphate-sugar epimerase